MPADVKAKTVRKTLPNLEAEAVGNTLSVHAIRSGGMTRYQKMEVQKTSDIEGEVKSKTLVAKLPYILTSVGSEAQVDTVVVTLADVKTETLADRGRAGR